MNDNNNLKTKELLDVIKRLIKENDYLKFENDTLIKQNKLHIALIDKQHQRIENINRLNEILSSINPKIKDYFERDHSINESNHTNKGDSNSNNKIDNSNNESDSSKNENDSSSNEMNSSSNEMNSSNNEMNSSNNEMNSSNNESDSPNYENIICLNESNLLNNEKNYQNNERNIENSINNSSLNNVHYSSDEIYFTIIEKLRKKFRKKYIDKVLSRYADEIFYIYKNEKIRVEHLQDYTDVSFPVIMRDIQFLKNHNWITKIGPHKGGHYTLTKIGKKLCEKELI